MSTLTLQVNNNLSVNILPNQEHEFLMTSKEVATGYGVAEKTVRNHLANNADELNEGKHFVKGAQILGTLTGTNLQPSQTFWTKRGIVRLGFFIRSERAKQFRDWAEDLIIYTSENGTKTGLEARIQELESQLSQMQRPALAPPSPSELQENLVAFFKKWLQRGDLSKLALEHNYSYRYLQAVKLGYKRSQAVEKLLLDTCLENRAKADNKNRMLN